MFDKNFTNFRRKLHLDVWVNYFHKRLHPAQMFDADFIQQLFLDKFDLRRVTRI